MARTLLDLAAGEPRLLWAAAREAERAGVLDWDALAELATRTRGHRGLRLLRNLLATYRPATGTRSELEVSFLDLVGEHGLPHPEVNVVVAGIEVDTLWRRERLIVELDGLAFHSGRIATARDRDRDLALRELGYDVLRLTWRQLREEPVRVAELIRRQLAHSTI